MALDMKKFLIRFAEEAHEHLNKLNEGLVRLENHPDDAETIDAVFRSAHTIKGSAKMMNLSSIAEVAHKLEDALGALRAKKMAYSRDLADVLFKGIDCISGLVEKVALGQDFGQEGSADTTLLCEELAKASEGRLAIAGGAAPRGSQPATAAAPAPSAGPETEPAGEEDETGQPKERSSTPGKGRGPDVPQPVSAGTTQLRPADSIRVNADKLDELSRLMGEIVSIQNRLKRRLSDVREAEKAAKRNMDLLAGIGDRETSLSDRKMIQSGRTLHAKLKQLASRMGDDASLQELLTAELQEKALMLRMVPLSTVFDSLPRMVRDAARSQGKDIELVIEGEDIGLDKKMIEKIGDPLVHMLRNAIDHGIEGSEERQKAGKRPQGTIKLSASYDAGTVVIELSDDGGGLALDKIREKALRKKMFAEAELNALTESEIVDLIFQPGFSTSPIITDLSGRGVGMDVVKKNIVQDLKGTIRIDTKPGRGTTFSLRLPMTLAVMHVLLVEACGLTFALIAHGVSEIARISESETMAVFNRKAIRLREELIPVAELGSLLKLTRTGGAKGQGLLILIVRLGNEKLGLIVDSLLEEEDIVIKALPAHMKNMPLVSGVTISDKNEIINILHVPGLIAAAGQTEQVVRAPEEAKASAARILVVDDSFNTRDIEKDILEAYGYSVDLAEDGQEAVEKTREAKYDLVITDVEMPRLDGFSLTERLRNDLSYKDTPIIIVTSLEKEEDKRRGIQVGANAYIVKGALDQTSLLETVQNLIG